MRKLRDIFQISQKYFLKLPHFLSVRSVFSVVKISTGIAVDGLGFKRRIAHEDLGEFAAEQPPSPILADFEHLDIIEKTLNFRDP